MVVQRAVLSHRCSGPWDLLKSDAVMAHASFHQVRPFVLWDIFLAKNLSHIVFVRVIRSVLAHVSDSTSVIRGHGKRAKATFHSCSIWSSMIQPVCDRGGGGGIMRGRSKKRAA